MRESKWTDGVTICIAMVCMLLVGCDKSYPLVPDSPLPADPTNVETTHISSTLLGAWADIQSGFITTLNNDGTYAVTFANGAGIQVGTWETSGNLITFKPEGDDPATMSFTTSADGKTMTIIDEDGVPTTLTR